MLITLRHGIPRMHIILSFMIAKRRKLFMTITNTTFYVKYSAQCLRLPHLASNMKYRSLADLRKNAKKELVRITKWHD